MTEIFPAIQLYSTAFDNLCQIRHDKEKPFEFIGEDIITEFMEALADCANMCREQFIKLMFLQSVLTDQTKHLSEDGENIELGIAAFKGST